ncbi:hypothetical protein BDV96DRAFT_598545 [Lophiotrema nucula]|uniref:Uncharacterized protein n=1 Tax=Lophiotrema nucula TaxID=690887 RepID=A0A6A5ZBR6_9PLEO|nr:hypothetical protein BDV96DRAFT_598545 [Lophiotrema nucula]
MYDWTPIRTATTTTEATKCPAADIFTTSQPSQPFNCNTYIMFRRKKAKTPAFPAYPGNEVNYLASEGYAFEEQRAAAQATGSNGDGTRSTIVTPSEIMRRRREREAHDARKRAEAAAAWVQVSTSEGYGTSSTIATPEWVVRKRREAHDARKRAEATAAVTYKEHMEMKTRQKPDPVDQEQQQSNPFQVPSESESESEYELKGDSENDSWSVSSLGENRFFTTVPEVSPLPSDDEREFQAKRMRKSARRDRALREALTSSSLDSLNAQARQADTTGNVGGGGFIGNRSSDRIPAREKELMVIINRQKEHLNNQARLLCESHMRNEVLEKKLETEKKALLRVSAEKDSVRKERDDLRVQLAQSERSRTVRKLTSSYRKRWGEY